MKKLRIGCAALLLLAGVALLAWPELRGRGIEEAEREAVQVFRALPKRQTAEEKPYEALYGQMAAYNRRIWEEGQRELKDAASCEQAAFDLSAFGLDDGTIGVLDVPSCGIRMPLYLGASGENLYKGACVVGGTSMPVGGENTNCVIAGHRSMYTATMFRHLDMAQPGDSVLITNLWGQLEYTVRETRIIGSGDVEEILIREGRDLVTLMTCHPYAGGSRQRLLVICERTG